MNLFSKKVISIILIILLTACGSFNKTSSNSEENNVEETQKIIYDNYEEFEVVDFGKVFNVDLHGKTIGTGGGLYRYKIFDTSENRKYWDEYKTALTNVEFEIEGDTAVKRVMWSGEDSDITVRITTEYIVDTKSHILITVLVSYRDI